MTSKQARSRVTELGILPIDKPGGMTSHDVVARVRKTLGIKKVGHAGTLDPLATGVLVVCLGRATRLSDYLMGQRKRYVTRVRLGVETNTLDADGEVTARSQVLPDGIESIEAAAKQFRGTIRQVPPMYSARKVSGKRLHELARAGKVVEREARDVEIDSLDILDYTPPFLDLDVRCSKGTYIRSLAADLGRALRCGGSVETLRRTEIGRIQVDQCVGLDHLTASSVSPALLDPYEALSDLQECRLTDEEINRFAHGNEVSVSSEPTDACRVTDEAAAFWGIGKVGPDGRLHPVCVLREQETARETHPA
ncbi:TPA: tRNA pseudouridine(55) synthase TruB [Candidatus Latescibacteria bacterium]|nr:tRNA pseudouridine(55) synthase TruB [Candidatus Latescibacterota bacterium]